jgi:hypothetical protein
VPIPAWGEHPNSSSVVPKNLGEWSNRPAKTFAGEHGGPFAAAVGFEEWGKPSHWP